MKKIYSYIGGMLLMTAMAFSITACSPDDFTSPNEEPAFRLHQLMKIRFK